MEHPGCRRPWLHNLNVSRFMRIKSGFSLITSLTKPIVGQKFSFEDLKSLFSSLHYLNFSTNCQTPQTNIPFLASRIGDPARDAGIFVPPLLPPHHPLGLCSPSSRTPKCPCAQLIILPQRLGRVNTRPYTSPPTCQLPRSLLPLLPTPLRRQHRQ